MVKNRKISKQDVKTDKLSKKGESNLKDFIRATPTKYRIIVGMCAVSIAAIFFSIGYFQPIKVSSKNNFVSNTSKYNKDAEKLSKLQRELSVAETSLSSAKENEKSVRDNTSKMDTDISMKQQTQISLSTDIDNLKDKKETLEEMIKTEQAVTTVQGSTVGQTIQGYGIYPTYDKLVHAYAEKYHYLSEADESLASQSGPYFIRAEEEYRKSSNQDDVTSALLQEGNLEFTQNEKERQQMACLLYDLVRAIQTQKY
ncbi:hypothetical protein [Lactococcus kimchii]|uniref:hypothetical protein n=1 Tax=Lactococcus sp. S-13 TaxID=2507158 RepID=UPI001022DECE|nr:hypothetical protein [Lactococcus sp. S-13]RZI48288.1 hypothetical protein EQJ87_01840 [Lactococcus sp. S-13]